LDWLQQSGVEIIELQSEECARMLAKYVAEHLAVWEEDIGEE
jgi:cytosine deaminase